MEFIQKILKPEYLFRPSQVWRRITRPVSSRPDVGMVTVPWNLDMEVRPHETVGFALWHLGVLDLPASEIIWRLLDAHELSVDVGANIGYVTGLMVRRIGIGGEVWSFEPHPEVHEDLASNVARWEPLRRDLARCRLHKTALSNETGRAILFEPPEYGGNHGTSSLESRPDNAGRRFEIVTDTFDRVFPKKEKVGVFKIDVEGHELSVFEGARNTIRERRIRDIVFEEHNPYPTEVTDWLAREGYTLFQISRGLMGPTLLPPDGRSDRPKWLPPNFLATLDPDRARSRCSNSGWHCLKGS